ncbi:bifunctional protein-disulfide isomerase/oxidoreductase DsbC [Idiomarina tyrosinivorans]|uniref:bifunctional protein-disulfide isomerase/oxidoreductase DsbC n=1 Tax=Idiomarina tyrosinivorans TaxID=1445662 RepID=UPI00130070D4|nr:bifunctional protein-disulfide isomerase/oxidoreductase DsbC [Idiomarina tyrosinivorans]
MKKSLLLGVLLGCLSVVSNAQDLPINTDRLNALKITVSKVEKTPIEGIYAAVTNQGLLYVSADGNYLFAGNLFDIRSNAPVNLTDQGMAELRQQQLKNVEDQMVVYKADNEKYHVTIFTDPTCPYCKKLHKAMPEYLAEGITVRYLAFPRGGMRTKGAYQLRQIWCSDDPRQTFNAIEQHENVDVDVDCDAPVAEHYQLGQVIGVTGTPAIILPNGQMIPGYQTAAQLADLLKQQSQSAMQYAE